MAAIRTGRQSGLGERLGKTSWTFWWPLSSGTFAIDNPEPQPQARLRFGALSVVAPTERKRKKKDLQTLVRENVESKSALYSDALKSYDGLGEEYAHQVIDHAVAYVDGQVHTNGMENFWSLLKRGIHGTPM
jgi:hypothetical protein